MRVPPTAANDGVTLFSRDALLTSFSNQTNFAIKNFFSQIRIFFSLNPDTESRLVRKGRREGGSEEARQAGRQAGRGKAGRNETHEEAKTEGRKEIRQDSAARFVRKEGLRHPSPQTTISLNATQRVYLPCKAQNFHNTQQQTLENSELPAVMYSMCNLDSKEFQML